MKQPTSKHAIHSVNTHNKSFYDDAQCIDYTFNTNGFRTAEFELFRRTESSALSFGCSHTMGESLHRADSWPEQLSQLVDISQFVNLGVNGVSTDFISRHIEQCIDYFNPECIFVLWPNSDRFEYKNNGKVHQSLPTDTNRIKFMATHDDEWCASNYIYHQNIIKQTCKRANVQLFALTLSDLNSTIDMADRWPKAVDNSHFDRQWHTLVANIFRYKRYANLQSTNE